MNESHEELSLDIDGTTYNFWQLYSLGKDKDVFELVESPNGDNQGKRFVMKQLKDNYGLVMKEYGNYNDDSLDTVIVPHGGITGSRYKRVNTYVTVELPHALCLMQEDEPVFIKHMKYSGLVEVNSLTEFADISICDFEDLIEMEFFKKA